MMFLMDETKSRPRADHPALLVAALVVSVGVLVPTSATGQATDGFRAEHFNPHPSQHTGVLNLRAPDVQSHLSLSAGLFSHYTDHPVKASEFSADPGTTIIQSHLTSELGLTLGLFDLAQVSVATPIVSAQWGRNMPGYPFESNSQADLGGFPYGDTRASFDLAVLKPAWTNGVGVSVNTVLRLPTGSPGDLTSDGRVRATPGVAVGKQWPGGHKLIANAGVDIGAPNRVPEYNYTDAGMVSGGVGGVVAVNPTVNLIGSIFGQGSVVDDLGERDGEPIKNTARSLEFLAGVRLNLSDFRIQSGLGAGLNSGLPAPDFRFFTSVNWLIDTTSQSTDAASSGADDGERVAAGDESEQTSTENDDAETETDETTKTADKPSDADDEKTRMASKTSADSADSEASSSEPTDQTAANEAETADEETEEPADGDGATQTADDADETENAAQPDDVELVDRQIDIDERIRFSNGSAMLDAESHSALKTVADFLQSHSQITKIVVKGHTDSRGSNAFNMRLSEQRAQAVKDFLVDQGIAPDRIETKGLGETQPLEAGNHTKNRRVDFVVKEVDGQPVDNAEAILEK